MAEMVTNYNKADVKEEIAEVAAIWKEKFAIQEKLFAMETGTPGKAELLRKFRALEKQTAKMKREIIGSHGLNTNRYHEILSSMM